MNKYYIYCLKDLLQIGPFERVIKGNYLVDTHEEYEDVCKQEAVVHVWSTGKLYKSGQLIFGDSTDKQSIYPNLKAYQQTAPVSAADAEEEVEIGVD